MPKVLDWQQDWPPATLACKHGNFDDLVKALDEGADPTLANPRGSTCLMICAVYGHVSWQRGPWPFHPLSACMRMLT